MPNDFDVRGFRKPIFRWLPPSLFLAIRKRWREYRDRKLQAIADHVRSRCSLTVQSGPFRGMVYAAGDMIAEVSRLLGCYEMELHGIIDGLLKNNYTRVIDVGSAEGYYAVGFAMRLPGAKVYAFESDPAIASLSREMARANGVSDRVTVAGECTSEILRELTKEPALVMCDCEGCELELLRPDLVPGLVRCDLLVELHDFIQAGIGQAVLQRFAASHHIVTAESGPRDPSVYPALDGLSFLDRRFAVSEFHWTKIQWAFLSSKMGRAMTGSHHPAGPACQ